MIPIAQKNKSHRKRKQEFSRKLHPIELGFFSWHTRFFPRFQYSLERSERVLRDAGVVSKVHSGPDGAEDERVSVGPARHADGVRRLQEHAVLVPTDLKKIEERRNKLKPGVFI